MSKVNKNSITVAKQFYEDLKRDKLSRASMVHHVRLLCNDLISLMQTNDDKKKGSNSDMDGDDIDEDVPIEVNNWLHDTFTKVRRFSKIESKEKFKAAAKLVKVNVSSDKMWKVSLQSASFTMPESCGKYLEDTINLWNFDVFEFEEMSHGHSLSFLIQYIFTTFGYSDKLKINMQTLRTFMMEVENKMDEYSNPFHNSRHTSQVVQSTHFFINQCNIPLTDTDILVLMMAAMVHNIDHRGVNNEFHVKTHSDLAILYNDANVNEHNHTSTAFQIMRQKECNFLENCSRDEYKYIRSTTIEVMLMSHSSYHFIHRTNLKSSLSLFENPTKTTSLTFMLQCADLGSCCKLWNIHRRWAELYFSELVQQGRREVELEFEKNSPMCHSEKDIIPIWQINLIDYIGLPTFELLGELINHLAMENVIGNMSAVAKIEQQNADNSSLWQRQLLENRQKWLLQV